MITIRPGNARGAAKLDWLDSRHTFSFAEYHDPRFMGYGALRPGEAVALRRRDLHLTPTPATITAPGTHSAPPRNHLLHGEDRGRALQERHRQAPRRIPAPWRARLLGVALGFAGIQLLNLVRVIALFLTGSYLPDLFDTSHTVVWQSVVVAAALVLWLFWAQRFAGAPAGAKRTAT